MNVTTVTAIWGAITGTLAIVVQSLNFWRDRAVIEINPSHILHTDAKNPKGTYRFILEIVNHGRRPIYIEGAGIELPPPDLLPGVLSSKSTLNIFPTDEIQSMHLDEGQKGSIIIDTIPYEIWEKLGNNGMAFVKDTRGRTFRKSFIISRSISPAPPDTSPAS